MIKKNFCKSYAFKACYTENFCPNEVSFGVCGHNKRGFFSLYNKKSTRVKNKGLKTRGLTKLSISHPFYETEYLENSSLTRQLVSKNFYNFNSCICTHMLTMFFLQRSSSISGQNQSLHNNCLKNHSLTGGPSSSLKFIYSYVTFFPTSCIHEN